MYKMRGMIEEIGRPVTIGSARKLVKQALTLKVVKRDIYDGTVIMENMPTFEFLGEKTKLLEHLRPGMMAEVGFEVIGREVTRADGSKVRVNNLRGLVAAELRREQRQQPQPQPQPQVQPLADAGRREAHSDDYEVW